MFDTTCPICGKPIHVSEMADWPSFPFCSRKCRIIDLGRWLGQEYRLTAPVADDAGEELPTGPGEDIEQNDQST